MARNGSRPAAATIAAPLTDSDELSAPAASVPVSPVVRKWVIGILVGVAIVTGIGRISKIVLSESGPRQPPHTELPLASSPQAKWSKLTVPAHDVAYIPRPSGMHIKIAGKNYTAYAVYPGGSECSFQESCPEGSTGANVKNESAEINVVSYAYEPD